MAYGKGGRRVVDSVDRDMLVRVDEQVKRLASDARSEKDTRARSHQAIHDELSRLRAHIDGEYRKLSERIDHECGKLSEQIRAGGEQQGTQIKWLERMAWIAIGAFGLARWLFN